MFAYVAIFLYLCHRKSKLRTIMRKLFSFLAMAAIVLGMASCGDGNDPNNPNTNTPTGLKVRIVYHSVGLDIIDYFQLTWNPVNGATAYKVYREEVWAHGEQIWQVYTPNRVIAKVTTPEFKDNSFDTEAWGYQSMKLKYTVTAITSKGESKPCEVVEEWWEPGV